MIEILVVRDPDMADEVTVWVDGVERTEDVIEIHVDAGAGYDFADWRENADGWARDERLSEACREAVVEAFLDPPGQRYIDDFKELGSPPMVCSGCGRMGTEDDAIEVGGPCQYEDDEDDPCDGIIEHNWKEPE